MNANPLSGHNLIFLKDDTERSITDDVIHPWLGHGRQIIEIVETVARNAHYPNVNKRALYSYYSGRAYADGRAITYNLRLPPPPIGLIAATFRETKGGHVRDKDEGQAVASPFWSAVRSVLSASRAMEARFIETMRSYTSDRSPYGFDLKELIQSDAFFFDAELMRMGCIHPVIFCKSKLFSLEGDQIQNIQSARLYIRNLDFESRYVDIVGFDAATTYVDQLTSHFEKTSSNAIRTTWNTLESLDWKPGQASEKLAKAVGYRPKKPPQKSRKA